MRTITAALTLVYVLASAALIVYLVANTHAGHVLGVKTGLIDDPEITEFQRQTVSHHMRLDRNLPAGRLIFLGDSHILGLDTMGIARDGVNFGIGNETTVGLLARVDSYRSVRRARAVVIGIGYNDIRRRDPAQIVYNIRSILARVSAPVVLCGLLPVSSGGAYLSAQAEEMNATIGSINNMLRPLCTKNCIFADPSPMIAASVEQASYYEQDGVHLNQKGYLIWTKLISHYVEML